MSAETDIVYLVKVILIAFLLVATGDGETIMKYCPSVQVVEQIQMGRSPQEACEIVVKRMLHRNGSWFEGALIALDVKVSVFVVKSGCGFKKVGVVGVGVVKKTWRVVRKEL